MVAEAIPGLLWRLTVLEADGKVARGFPKIYQTEAGFKAAIRMQERLPTAWKRTMIKEGCARGPWLSLDGPVNHWSTSPGPHAVADCLPTVGEPKPDVLVFYEAA